MRILNVIYSMFFNKCPRCHHGDVFKSGNPFVLSRLFHIHERCSACDLKYEREPFFFYGAMYVSYALTSGWFIIWYILFLTVLNIDALTFALLIATSILILSPVTIRWSRLIWLNFFNKFDPQLKASKQNAKQEQGV